MGGLLSAFLETGLTCFALVLPGSTECFPFITGTLLAEGCWRWVGMWGNLHDYTNSRHQMRPNILWTALIFGVMFVMLMLASSHWNIASGTVSGC